MKSDIEKGIRRELPYIVAIGASAGGLEAIHEFFDNMPVADQLSFVVIQHLSPDHKSLLVDLVAKHTHMNVQEATQGVKLQPKTVYIIPPGKVITVKNLTLQVDEKPANKNVIDTFLFSLAKEVKDKAIALILSGTGTDGTRGSEEIRNNGGLVIAQDPVTARFDGMLRSVIQEGHIDYVLAPELMPLQIFEFINEPLPFPVWDEKNGNEEHLDEIFKLLFKYTGCDFQYYKKPTLMRRIMRRMTHKKINTLEGYIKELREDIDEVKTLCQEFLIGVTRFFRDHQPFEIITNEVLPKWVADSTNSDVFKVWVPACSTGQEAYSIAMIIHHFFESNRLPNQIKVFATDVDKNAIEFAAKGCYPHTIEQEVNPLFLSKYFLREGDYYHIHPDLRKLIVFAKHNIITDPPFIRNDFVSCRNMLIYMDVNLQKKILSTLYFSMNPGGYLLLGPSETASILSENIREIDRKWKIFQKLPNKQNGDSQQHSDLLLPKLFSNAAKEKNISNVSLKRYENILLDIISNEYKFAGVFVDKNYIVREAIGNYRHYIELPEKKFHLNITKMVSHDVAIVLNSAMRKSLKENNKVEIKGIKIKGNSEFTINLLVFPPIAEHYGFYFLVFSQSKIEEKINKIHDLDIDHINSKVAIDYIQELKNELHETENNLQQAIESLESANQELQATNEEMLSANEELQSSNEELQSLNEELHTLNTEHQQKISELVELNDDLTNYLRNSDVGQIFIDKKLRVRKFNPVSTRMINLIDSDINRPLGHISHNLLNINIINEIRHVINTNTYYEREVTISSGAVCLMRITPYVKQDKSYDGVVLSFVDISKLKELNSLIKATFNASNNPVIALKVVRNDDGTIKDLVITTLNEKAANLVVKNEQELINNSFADNFTFIKSTGVYQKLIHVFETGKLLKEEIFDEENKKWFEISSVRMNAGLVVTLNDITRLKIAEENLIIYVSELETIKRQLELSNEELQQFTSIASHDLKEPLRKIQMIVDLLKKTTKDKLDESEKKNFEILPKATKRMRNLIDSILEFSSLSHETTFKKVDLNNLLKECLFDLSVLIDERKAHVTCAEFPKISGVPHKLRQLMLNLMANALKFSKPDKEANIIISCERLAEHDFDSKKDKNGNYILISVEDDGIGFDQKYADKIFTMFQRLSTDTPGTGIGLAICKKIVDQHNGLIRAFGEEEKGARFEVLLPIDQVEHQKRRLSNKNNIIMS